MATVVRSFAIQGIDGYPVDIEVKMLEGQPVISIIGLGDQAVKEAAERIQAAIDESGYVFPKKRVIISLAPSDKKKSGSHFDLAMAVGVLCQNGDIGVKKLPDYGFIGELSLDGRLRACRGILPMIIAGQKRGMKKIIVPEANLKEASLVLSLIHILAFIFSISIEMLQLLMRLGTFQLSDIFYNTVGGMLGGLMYCGTMKARKCL